MSLFLFLVSQRFNKKVRTLLECQFHLQLITFNYIKIMEYIFTFQYGKKTLLQSYTFVIKNKIVRIVEYS